MTDREEFLSVVDVSRETLEKLDIYATLLRKWNPKINLVSRSTLDALWSRHFLDSAQLLDLAPPATTWADLGSGGGFPGLVLAIMSAESNPGTKFTLVEADQRKAAFLSTVARETDLAVRVIPDRIENVPPIGADVLSARALAPLPRLVQLIQRHLAPNGIALLPKGAGVDAELKEALALCAFDVQKFPSRTDPHGVMLKIGGLSRG